MVAFSSPSSFQILASLWLCLQEFHYKPCITHDCS